MRKESEAYCLKDYGRKSTFASFLPGIAGIKGIPIWCYYVNRGQGVVSFGVDNKDHAIMEFYPAHQAYQNVKRTGFRTFLRKDGVYMEPFSKERYGQDMLIKQNAMEVTEENTDSKLFTKVRYFVLPEETAGALVRTLTVTNLDETACELEILDGMPAVIPYGVNMETIKEMCQTAKAWMQVEDREKKVPYFRVRVSMDDSASVRDVDGGNFSAGYLVDGTMLEPVVDADAVFGYDNSLTDAVVFAENGLDGVQKQKQNSSNLLPCSFYGVKKTLLPGESITIYELIGQVEDKSVLAHFMETKRDQTYFEHKYDRAMELMEELCKGITTKTASKSFDAYCKYTYMDNVLRGGLPMRLGNNKIYYVYSRKHGDLERDYNYFSMLPEYFSQGNGNFRDVNQNRRCDTFFAPFVERENIRTFYSLIQLDGYNPLGIEKITYQMKPAKAEAVLKELPGKEQEKLKAFVEVPFTPGALYKELEKNQAESLFYQIIDFADSTVNGNFGEGYWSDHWTYNLDLIEDYLEIFPEKEEEMLYDQTYSYFLSQVNINPRRKRYEETEKGIRQYHALNETSKRTTKEKLVRSEFGKGQVVYGTLMEKLLLLCAAKFAALDSYGMGVEMEGGKPGWYDALNGMPGMLGSSMAETYELARMLHYTISALQKYPGKVSLLEELGDFVEELHLINHLETSHIMQEKELLSFWNKINDAKEIYREKTYQGISGNRAEYTTEMLVKMLSGFYRTVEKGIEKAVCYGNGMCPTYFTYEVVRYEKTRDGIEPLEFAVQSVPYFLEGPVRYLKLDQSREQKEALYEKVKHSDLYDKSLQMYKVNASMEEASYELGRARAFTPGWLENESIWLHMEYKYLLEVLKSGMYEAFASDFKQAAVPFLEEEVYGRSILENSSFIASSKNPNEKIRGKGFVARLSGSTIEFISMWKLMMFGKHPFELSEEGLICKFQPVIPSYLIGEEKYVEAMFLGKTKVRYEFKEQGDYFPGSYDITGILLIYENGTQAEVNGDTVTGQFVQDLRGGRIKQVTIFIKK